jgi:hypothetical protein
LIAGRHLRVAGLVAATAALLAAAAPASADGAAIFVHSAASGELSGKRLTLREVGPRVSWIHNGGRAGRIAVRKFHRRLFLPGKPATGTLHVAGHRGGQEPAFRLSKPRYDAGRGTVSYSVKSLGRVRLPGRAARPAQGFRQFGAASLSVAPHAQVASGDNGGNDCGIGLVNETGYGVQVTGASSWDTDSWDPAIPSGQIVPSHSKVPTGADLRAFWQSDGGFVRGCSNTSTWQLVVDPNDPTQAPPPAGVTFTLSMSWPWGSGGSPSCSSTNAQFYCIRSGSYYILRGPVPCCMPAPAVAASRR